MKLQEKQVFSLHKHEKCRICLVDKFGIFHGRGRRLRLPAGRPGRGSGVPPALHSLPLPFEAIYSNQQRHHPNGWCLCWQGKKASNPRPTVLETAALPAELFPYIKKYTVPNQIEAQHSGFDLERNKFPESSTLAVLGKRSHSGKL